MSETGLKIALPDGSAVSAIWTEAKPASGLAFVYAPGAGSSLKDAFGDYAAAALAERGIGSLRFQFPYSEAGRKLPDKPPLLEATWRAAIEVARARGKRLVVGGRSMGGRIASQVVAGGEAVDALALFAYPLHPPGRPDQRRDAHLTKIEAPVLFCSGDRDTFALVEELEGLTAMLPRARPWVLAGADHGFAVLKASGRKREDVWQEAIEALLGFVKEELG
ncbi:MAG: dienelactone hydrolase [Dehalococcoidia bacterium]|nr:dienelactone hydrolase [Dehalococcoidia bacterium]